MFVVYDGFGEILITTKEAEAEMIKEWFIDADRDLDEFDREECDEPVLLLRSEIKISN